ncbi:MAG: DNA polymerase III subunit delta [Lachnospiraceae bacterium]|nr:DNA polymerase III subunit delta [Lachnospiraceae bacterium]
MNQKLIKEMESRLKKDLREKTFHPVYLLYGAEDFMVRHYYRKLCEALGADPSDMNTQVFEGKDVSVDQIIDAARTMPFFAERRVILLRGTGLAKTGGLALAKYLEEPADTSVIVMMEEDVDEKCKLSLVIQNAGVLLECKKQGRDYLLMNVAGRLLKVDKVMNGNAADLLLERTGDSMYVLSNELDKLISYVGDRNEITMEDVDAICIRTIDDQIFRMMEALTVCDQKTAMDAYYDLMALKEPPPKIIRTLANQFMALLRIKTMRAEGHPVSAIQQEMSYQSLPKDPEARKVREEKDKESNLGFGPEPKYNSYRLGKMIEQAGRCSTELLQRDIALMTAAEYDFKSGRMDDRIALEMLLLRMTRQD